MWFNTGALLNYFKQNFKRAFPVSISYVLFFKTVDVRKNDQFQTILVYHSEKE